MKKYHPHTSTKWWAQTTPSSQREALNKTRGGVVHPPKSKIIEAFNNQEEKGTYYTNATVKGISYTYSLS